MIDVAARTVPPRPRWARWVAWTLVIAFVVAAIFAWDDRRKFARYQLAQTRFQEFATVYKLIRHAYEPMLTKYSPADRRIDPIKRDGWTRWLSTEKLGTGIAPRRHVFHDRHDGLRFLTSFDGRWVDLGITCWDTNGTETLTTVALFGHNGDLIFQPEGKVRDDGGDMVPIERRSWW